MNIVDPTIPRTFGTCEYPFAASSHWNSRPVNAVLSEPCIPKSQWNYFPSIASGKYSTGVFVAKETDQPMTVCGPDSSPQSLSGASHADAGGSRVIILPRWPAGVLPAAGADGHADIFDPVTKVIHSFWKLRPVDNRWVADMYAWSRVDGTGWGGAAHSYQGARAVGVPPIAGIIRKHEINDGDSIYRHALAVSLAHNALSNGVDTPAYIYPATSADGSLGGNSGTVPEGARLMLPADFDYSKITDPKLIKIVRTLQVYGAYVVDRNDGTPFVMYVENGSDFDLHGGEWNNTVAGWLDSIRAELRQVLSVENWIDGNGMGVRGIGTPPKQNLLSMRGGWGKQKFGDNTVGTTEMSFNSATQQVEFASNGTRTRYANANNTGMTKVSWAQPEVGDVMKIVAATSNGALVRVEVKGPNKFAFDSGFMTNGETKTLVWPGPSSVVVSVEGGGVKGMSTARAMLTVV